LEKCWIGGEYLIRMADFEVRSVTDPHGLGTAPSAASAEESTPCCGPALAHRLAALAGLILSLPALLPRCAAHLLNPSKRRIRTRIFVVHPTPEPARRNNKDGMTASPRKTFVAPAVADAASDTADHGVFQADSDERAKAPKKTARKDAPAPRTRLGAYHVLAGPPGSGLLPRSLPALWDVLVGRIALVGVEPLTPEEAEVCVEPWERVRFSAPPGLVQPRHAFSSRPLPQSQKRAMEHFYSRSRTVRGDIRLLVRAVLRRVLG
ncbi:MAG: sugar transferase, partial [Oceanidesulfovibrio sp.]